MRSWTDRDAEIAPVHCAGCGRCLGVAPVFRRVFRVMYCDGFCWHKPHIYELENENRDQQVRALHTYAHVSTVKLALAFELSRSRIQQIVGIGKDDYLLNQPTVMSDEVRQLKASAGKAGGTARSENRKSARK